MTLLRVEKLFLVSFYQSN